MKWARPPLKCFSRLPSKNPLQDVFPHGYPRCSNDIAFVKFNESFVRNITKVSCVGRWQSPATEGPTVILILKFRPVLTIFQKRTSNRNLFNFYCTSFKFSTCLGVPKRCILAGSAAAAWKRSAEIEAFFSKEHVLCP